MAVRWVKKSAGPADHCVARHNGGGPTIEGMEAPMSVMMSWARSTLANLDHRLGRDQWYDRILVGVMILPADDHRFGAGTGLG